MEKINQLILKGIRNSRRAFIGPRVAQIDLIGQCNNSCIGCWVHSPFIKNPPRDKNLSLSFRKVKELIDDLSRLGTEQIFLSGAGEPFLHPNILEIIKLIKKQELKLNIITNFTLIDEAVIEKLVDLGVDMVTASVWAAVPQTYIKTHPTKTQEDFYKIKDSLKKLSQLKFQKRRYLPRVKIYNVICNLNYSEIQQMIDFALDVQAEFIEFQIMDIVKDETSFLALSGKHLRDIEEQFSALNGRQDLYFKELELLNIKITEEIELQEFPGRFIRVYPGFTFREWIGDDKELGKAAMHSLRCPAGVDTFPTKINPEINEEDNKITFSFPQGDCKKCSKFGNSCLTDDKGKIIFNFLKILGFGSFVRRLNSANIYEQSYESSIVNNMPCYAGWVYSRILSTGEIIPCCKASKKVLGNINEKKFLDIWNSRLYCDFRYKAKNSAKSNFYFKNINCFKSCDNVGMNLQIKELIFNKNEKQEKKIKSYPAGERFLPQAKDKIIISASNFSKGNLNKGNHQFGEGIIIDGGYGFGFAEYNIYFKDSAGYELWFCYAAEQSRPAELYFDGNLIKKEALSSVTGGWTTEDLRWFKEFSCDIEEGCHTLKIYTKSFISHTHSFAFVKGFKPSPKKVNPVGKSHFLTVHVDSGIGLPPGSIGNNRRLSRANTFSSSGMPFAEKSAALSNGVKKYLSEDIYRRPFSFRLLSDKFKTIGFIGSVSKLINYIASGRLVENYLDILGIFNGAYAFKGPFHVQIDLTNNCNNDCIGCWCNSPLLEEKILSHQVKIQSLPFGLAKELLDELSQMGTKEIYFSGGGEPFMHPNIMEILAYAKKKNFTCYINTNFTLLDKERIKEIIDLGIDHLTVSTWSAAAKTYALTHPNKSEDTFIKITENLKFLNENKRKIPYIKLYNVIFNLNCREFKDMVYFVKETGSESVEFTLVDTIPGKTDKLLLNSCEIKELQKDAQVIADKLDKQGCLEGVLLFRFDSFLRRISSLSDLSKATYDRNIIDKIPCYIGWCFSRIIPNGDVNACLKAHRIPVGNLYENNFYKIWNHKKQQDFRRETRIYEKKTPFFQLIGNDPNIKEAGCYKSCDDIGRNVYIHNRIMSLTPVERQILKVAAKLKQKPSLNPEFKHRYADLVVRGIKDGRKSFIGPEQVVVDITNRCNEKCIGCWLYSPLLKDKPNNNWLKQEMKFSKAKRLIDDFSIIGTKRIRFTGGGEPFMHPNIIELIAYAKSKGLFCCLTTNFSLPGKKTVRDLIKLELDELAVSLWASNEKTYQKTHPSAASDLFRKIEDNLMVLATEKKDKPFVTLCNVICNLNYLEAEEMFKFAVNKKADGVYFTLMDIMDGTQELLLDEKQRYLVLKQAERIEESWQNSPIDKRVKLDYFHGFVSRLKNADSFQGRYDKERINQIPCYAGWFFSRVLADGTVCPCCRGVKKVIGNINKKSFKDIWFSQVYNEFRTRAKYLPKEDPYFSEIGCIKMCDNLMHNEEVHSRVKA